MLILAHEQAAARRARLSTVLVDHTRVLRGQVAEAVAGVPEGLAAAIYRGWMLTPSQYPSLHGALRARGVTLVNTPEAYRTCHYLPDSYPFIEGQG
jgi:hypothetical protein